MGGFRTLGTSRKLSWDARGEWGQGGSAGGGAGGRAGRPH